MSGWRAIGLFCEDIREEKSGQDTLVGIFTDNLNVPMIPGSFPKLGIYVRINLEPNTVSEMAVALRFPSGEEISLAKFDADFIKQQTTISQGQGAPLVGLITKAVASPAVIQKAGRILLLVKIDEHEFVCGSLNVQPIPANPSSNPPAPPASQSQPAS